MKWSEFKKLVEEKGVKDEDEVWYIDIAFDEEFTAVKDDRLGWLVYS